MPDLGPIIGRLDDAARALDAAMSSAVRHTSRKVSVDAPALEAAAHETRTALGAALPDSLLGHLSTNGSELHFSTASQIRAKLAQLGAAAKAVEQLGGVESVVRQGGLDAVDGAVELYRRGVVDHLKPTFKLVDDALDLNRGWFAPGAEVRKERLEELKAVTELLREVDPHIGMTTRNLQAKARMVDRYFYSPSGSEYKAAVKGVREWMDAIHAAGDRLPTAPDNLASTLSSGSAKATHARQGMVEIPEIVALASLPDDAAVAGAAIPSLDRHEQVVTVIGDRLQGVNRYDKEFRTRLAMFRDDARRMTADLERIRPLVAEAPDAAEQALDDALSWTHHAEAEMQKAALGKNVDFNTVKFLEAQQINFGELRTQLQRLLDDPSLATVRLDTREEVAEIFARPGHLDVAALRSVLEGDTPVTARRAIVASFADGPRIDPATPAATSVEESLRLLDEADLIDEAIQSIARRDPAPKSYWLMLDEEGIRHAIADATKRRQLALGTADMLPDRIVSDLRQDLRRIPERLATHDGNDTLSKLTSTDLQSARRSAATYRSKLADLSARADRDGGLRTLSPSTRVGAARDANRRWLLDELDAMSRPAADATPEAQLDHVARRISLLADLSDATPRSLDPVLRRIRTELDAIDAHWLMPDDTAISLELMRHIEPEQLATLDMHSMDNTARSMRRIAADLRAWRNLDDGVLPTTDVDRLAVAARRATDLAEFVTGSKPGKAEDLTKWLMNIRSRIAVVERTMPARGAEAELRAVHAATTHVDAALDRYAELAKTYKSSRWSTTPEDFTALHESVAALAARIEQDHVDLRAAARASGAAKS